MVLSKGNVLYCCAAWYGKGTIYCAIFKEVFFSTDTPKSRQQKFSPQSLEMSSRLLYNQLDRNATCHGPYCNSLRSERTITQHPAGCTRSGKSGLYFYAEKCHRNKCSNAITSIWSTGNGVPAKAKHLHLTISRRLQATIKICHATASRLTIHFSRPYINVQRSSHAVRQYAVLSVKLYAWATIGYKRHRCKNVQIKIKKR